jgi:hypothetical protein
VTPESFRMPIIARNSLTLSGAQGPRDGFRVRGFSPAGFSSVMTGPDPFPRAGLEGGLNASPDARAGLVHFEGRLLCAGRWREVKASVTLFAPDPPGRSKRKKDVTRRAVTRYNPWECAGRALPSSREAVRPGGRTASARRGPASDERDWTMDYHVTPASMDLARQMLDLGLNWPGKVGDHFCSASDDLRICMEVERDGEQAWVVDANGGRLEFAGVAWIPKRSQCMEWFAERGWTLRFVPGEKYIQVEATNRLAQRAPIVEALGECEQEALFDALSQILELEEELRP